MTIRERIENEEKDILSPYACLSVNSKGREREEEQCDIRPVFQRDSILKLSLREEFMLNNL